MTMSDKIEDTFFLQHELRVNRIVVRIYYGLLLLPILVCILSFNNIYNYDKTLSVVGIVVSWLLALLLFILRKFQKTQRIIKYVLLFSLQFIVILYSIDINVQMSVLYAIVPLLALAYFNPKLELLAGIASTISITLGTCIVADQATRELYVKVTPLFYILTTGGGRLAEFIFADVIFYKIAALARSIMNNFKTKNTRLNSIQDNLVFGFADMIESRDGTTGEHVKRTSETVKLITDYIRKNNSRLNINITENELNMISMAAPLHDIGKMKVPDSILSKPGKLTDQEFNIIKTHTTEGGKLIQKIITNLEDPEYVQIAYDMAYYHHEKWNGKGYPEQLEATNIPISARIMAVADVFDALCSRRSYKEAYSIDEAYKIMIESKGSHFEPILVDIMLDLRQDLERIYQKETA